MRGIIEHDVPSLIGLSTVVEREFDEQFTRLTNKSKLEHCSAFPAVQSQVTGLLDRC